MAWNLRKSESPGPLRFDLSKNGIGASTSQELASQSQHREELLFKLNKSYKSLRLDHIVGIFFILLLILFALKYDNTVILVFFFVFGLIIIFVIGSFETKRRTVLIQYEFDDESFKSFNHIIFAFNILAKNKKIWILTGPGKIFESYVGEGKPPWVNTNILIPVLKVNDQNLYMMPDGILIYGDRCVRFIEYHDVAINHGIKTIIENNPPGDTTIVGNTWKYAKKDGGRDMRFNNNYKIPICLFGELEVISKSGLLLRLRTSKYDSPAEFIEEFTNILK